MYQHTTEKSICVCYRSSLPLKTSRLWNPCGTWFIQAQGLSRHSLRYPRLSQCGGERREVTMSGTLIAANFLITANFLAVNTHMKKTPLQDLSDFTKKWGRYHMEKSLDLWTWLSEQGEMSNKDRNVHSEYKHKSPFFPGRRLWRYVSKPYPSNLNLCRSICLTAEGFKTSQPDRHFFYINI